MLRRFAAATAVASCVAGIASLVVLLLPGLPLERFAPVLALWCMAPAVRGLWAMAAPRTWVPERLPVWGAILGLVAGTLAFFVLNLPSRIADFRVTAGPRASGLVLLTGFYYLLWMAVRAAYHTLTPDPRNTT